MNKPEEMTDKEWRAWLDCAIPGCSSKSCRNLESVYCYIHTHELIVYDTNGLGKEMDSVSKYLEKHFNK